MPGSRAMRSQSSALSSLPGSSWPVMTVKPLAWPRMVTGMPAAAGPAANLVIAVIAAALFHVLPILSPDFGQWVGYNLRNAIWINVLLCVFNMIPIPPLDGGRVAVGLLPAPLSRPLARLERKGIFIVLGLVFIVPWIGGKLGVDLNVFWWLVGVPTEYLKDIVFTLTGHN